MLGVSCLPEFADGLTQQLPGEDDVSLICLSTN